MNQFFRIKTILIFFLFVNTAFSQTENPKLKITHLIGDFYVFTTYKTFKDKPMSANGMYIVAENGVVMFDTPWDKTQYQPLLDSIKVKHNKDVIVCIATHSHEDRTGGIDYYKEKGIKTYTTKQTDKICKERDESRAEFLIEKDSVFKIGKYNFQTYYDGQGHTPDNIIIWFENEKILYGGCLVKSIEANDLGYLGDANVKEWEKTIKKVQNKFKKPKFIITGHQDWKSTNTLNHTLKLIKQNIKNSR